MMMVCNKGAYMRYRNTLYLYHLLLPVGLCVYMQSKQGQTRHAITVGDNVCAPRVIVTLHATLDLSVTAPTCVKGRRDT